MSALLQQLPLGAQLSIRAPSAAVQERAARLRAALNRHSTVLFLAGGTGVFAVFSIINEWIHKPNPPAFVLLHGYARHTETLLSSELQELSTQHPSKLRHRVFLEHPPRGWEGGVGFITAGAIREEFSGDGLYVTCGPPAMHRAMSKNLDLLSVPINQRHDL